MAFSTRARSAFAASLLLSTALPAIAFADEAPPPQPAAPDSALKDHVEKVTVTAARLDKARNKIETQTGASTYTINQQAIDTAPGGDNTLLNQVVLQAPSVAQDSFGQFHIRGDHNGLQYRLNGVILPEGISVFGQTLDARLISSLQLITGALPAEYGLRTAGIIDLKTRSGLFEPGETVSVYGGSHGLFEPSFSVGGSAGSLNYFVTGDYLENGVGIESPDGRPDPIHDRTTQYHGFGYFEDILDDSNRVTLVLGTSHDQFQIPDRAGQSAGLGLTVQQGLNLFTDFPSDKINENQREITQYAVASFQHSQGDFDIQTSLSTRYSSLFYSPDPLADLLYDGIAQTAYKRDVAVGLQTDSAYQLNATHTLRAGFYIQHDKAVSDTSSDVLPTDALGNQTSNIPVTIVDNSGATQWIYSAYLQDEWNIIPELTINYGVRFDAFEAFDSESQFGPRLNVVWQPADGTTLHAGYARYFTPPPFELIGSETVAKFADTTAAPAVTQNDVAKAEKANYFDVGAQQKLLDNHLTLGVDSFLKLSHNLIDEGQFGAPIILTPFNYKDGKQYGVEFTAAYDSHDFSAYGNLALEHAEGKDIVSSQFDFDPGDLAYIQNHYIHLDHEQALTASAGASYLWDGTRFSADLLIGSGLRKDGAAPNGDHLPTYEQVNAGISHAFELTGAGVLTARVDVINVFDQVYEIRDGTGVGVGAPQFGPRRGFFVGVSESL